MSGPELWAERARATILLVLVLAQGALGWTVRQHPAWLQFHLLAGITLLLPVSLHAGLRAALGEAGATRRHAAAAALLVAAQLVVGGLAFLVPETLRAGSLTGLLDRALVLLHWLVGIAAVVASIAWWLAAWRLPRDPSQAPDASARMARRG
jgi:hypothetical protein